MQKRREEPTFGAERLTETDLQDRPRRRSAPSPSPVDWRLVWSIVFALVIWRLLEVIGAAVLARLALWRLFGV